MDSKSVESPSLNGNSKCSGISNTKTKGDNGLAKNETRNVHRFRVVVAIVLILSTISMAVTIYFFVRNSELTNFHSMFLADANKVLGGIGESIKGNLAAMDAFASMMVSIAKETNQTFPFVTIPTFAIKASKLLTLSDGFLVTTQPVVRADQRLKWEKYSMENQWWVNETKAIQEIDVFFNDAVTYGDENYPTIFGLNGTLPYDDA
jgi:hypothetical protein